MEHKGKVLLVTRHHEVLLQKLSNMGYECVFKEALPYTVALSEMGEYKGVVTSNHLPVDKPLIDAGNQLAWIGRLGSGMEIVDLDYARQKGIACFSTPEGNANAVAEQALGMLLMLEHNILRSNREIKNGQWLREENRGHEIKGKTAGIIGLGNNGSRFAKKLIALGLKVLAYDTAQNNYDLAGVTACGELTLIYEQAEILSFHVPLNKETLHYFDEALLEKMQQRFMLLNLSRGSVVNQKVLYNGLKSGKIIGAALDVWENEPFWKGEDKLMAQQASELLAMPNFIGTPHIGGYTYDALYKMSCILADKVEKFLEKS